MASRIIHLAVTNRILRSYACKDQNRLELGAILPDAASGWNSHWRIRVGTKAIYDLTGFRSRFFSEMMADDLYLGYYLHLAQDMFFRDFVYHRYHWSPFPPGNVEGLHNDYALLNQYVIQKYALQNTLTLPASWAAEPLNELGPFSLRQFMAELETDFQGTPTGTPFFFTREMADEFIACASEACEREIFALHHGLDCIDERLFAIEKG